jgi:hypothetical protein
LGRLETRCPECAGRQRSGRQVRLFVEKILAAVGAWLGGGGLPALGADGVEEGAVFGLAWALHDSDDTATTRGRGA